MKCPLHNEEMIFDGNFRQVCIVDNCQHIRFSPTQNPMKKVKVYLPFWCGR